MFLAPPYRCRRCFALKAIPKGTKLCPVWGTLYAGPGRSAVERKDEETSSFELLTVPGYPELILAMHPASCARYINDGLRSSREANVLIEMDHNVDSAAQIAFDSLFITSRKDIAEGEELLTSYGDNYWSHTARQKLQK